MYLDQFDIQIPRTPVERAASMNDIVQSYLSILSYRARCPSESRWRRKTARNTPETCDFIALGRNAFPWVSTDRVAQAVFCIAIYIYRYFNYSGGHYARRRGIIHLSGVLPFALYRFSYTYDFPIIPSIFIAIY